MKADITEQHAWLHRLVDDDTGPLHRILHLADGSWSRIMTARYRRVR